MELDYMEEIEDLDGLGEYDGYNYYDPGEVDDMYDGDQMYPGMGGEMDHMYDQEQVYQRISSMELLDKCISPTLSQALGAIFPLLAVCLISRLMHILFADDNTETGVPKTMLHIASAMFGLLAAHMFFDASCTFLVILAVFSYLQMCVTVRLLQGRTGPMTAGLVVIFVLACELLIVESEDWHRIRGAQMVLSMKVISLGFDVDQGHVPVLPSIWQFCGYVFHPGSIIFGPWVSYKDYIILYNSKRKRIDVYWGLKVIFSTALALFCVVHSTCFVHWMILDNWGRWSLAFRDAQSFRFSHYFVSYVSEATSTLSGLGTSTSKPTFINGHKANGNQQPPKQPNGDVRWDLTVTKPFHVELPRSLSEVVSNWNLPMHYWLKNYVFRPSQHLGTFSAVLLTYIASSILHGLNFQLAAVLLSLGFYSYVEYQLRRKLCRVFDACIGPKRCKDHCDHRYKATHPTVMAINLSFCLLAVFHLAYLGLMFDSSEGHEEGYTMSHTLSKWSGLGYASHCVALGTYIIYLLI